MAVAPPDRAALDFPVFRRFHEITAHLTPIQAPDGGRQLGFTHRSDSGWGPALPDAAAPTNSQYPGRYRSSPKRNQSLGNSTAFSLETPPGTGTRDLLLTGQQSPEQAPRPRALRSAGLSLQQPSPSASALRPGHPSPRPGSSAWALPPSVPAARGRPGEAPRCERAVWARGVRQRGAVRKGGGRSWGHRAEPLSPCRLGGCAGR